jgi:hypothetical protein
MGFQTGDMHHSKEMGVKYHKVHICWLLHKWGFVPKMPQKKFVRTATHEERVLKKVQEVLTNLKTDVSYYKMNPYLYMSWIKKKKFSAREKRP